MMECAELLSSNSEEAQAAAMNATRTTARQPWRAPECRSLALGDRTQIAPASSDEGGSLVS